MKNRGYILAINDLDPSGDGDLDLRIIKDKAKALRCFHNAIRKYGADKQRIVEIKDEKCGSPGLQCHSTQGGDWDSLCITLFRDVEIE